MGNLRLRISLPSRWPPPGARHRAHGFGDQSAYRATSSASSPLRGSANPETRRSDTPTAGFGPRWVGYLEPGAGTTGLRVSGVSGSVTTAMVLDLALLGSVWLTGLTAVHCVSPQPLRRCRCALRAAAQAATQRRPRTPPPANLQPLCCQNGPDLVSCARSAE